jgi:uncharacterized protein (DUF58 family)
VGLALVDHAIRERHPPVGTTGGLLALLERLEEASAGGETGLAKALDELAEGLSQRRGLVVVISDTFDDADAIVRALAHLRHRRQDVLLVQVIDPREETFPFKGTCEFVGLEGEPRLRLDADRVRHLYRRAMAAHTGRLAAGCHAGSVVLEGVRTDEDLAAALVRALGYRRSVRGRGT